MPATGVVARDEPEAAASPPTTPSLGTGNDRVTALPAAPAHADTASSGVSASGVVATTEPVAVDCVASVPLLDPRRQRELIRQAAGLSTRQVAGLIADAAGARHGAAAGHPAHPWQRPLYAEGEHRRRVRTRAAATERVSVAPRPAHVVGRPGGTPGARGGRAPRPAPRRSRPAREFRRRNTAQRARRGATTRTNCGVWRRRPDSGAEVHEAELRAMPGSCDFRARRCVGSAAGPTPAVCQPHRRCPSSGRGVAGCVRRGFG